jgi:hypothetical protein
MPDTILEGYLLLAKFAEEEVQKHPRTVDRWTKEPDGLPYTWMGNQKYLHVPTAREWLFNRMRHPNARRTTRAREFATKKESA